MPELFGVAKINKRLWIVEGDRAVYTPPDFVRLPSREPLLALASKFNECGAYDISAVSDFETEYSSRMKSKPAVEPPGPAL